MLTPSLPAAQPAVPYKTFTVVANQKDFTNYIVQNGDYLSSIADAYFGSEDYWTNIWNDNPEVDDAAQLEEGVILKIRKTKTPFPEVLKSELTARLAPEPEVLEPTYTYSVESGVNMTQSVAAATPTAALTTTPQVTQQPVAPVTSPQSLTEAQISYLGSCEAGMDPAKNTGNGYYGAFQFSASTWNSMGTGYARADLAPLEVQKDAVQRLVGRSSIHTQFPGCAKKMRSNGLI